MKRFYVGNLKYSLEKEDLQDLFSQFGDVTEVSLPMDRMTGRKRGFGFVDMDIEDETEVIEKLDGFDLDGRKLNVSLAREREERPSRGRSRDR